MNWTLERDVRKLALAGGREAAPRGRGRHPRVGSHGHGLARQFIVGRLQQLGLEPYADQSYELPYEVEGQSFVNIVAKLPGSDTGALPILIGAHYDTCGPHPGADDNAAAVSAALHAAELLASVPPARTVVFAFFDAEEPKHFLTDSMGSTRFYEDQSSHEFACAIVLDLVGHQVPVPGLGDAVFVLGAESDPSLEDVVRHADSTTALPLVPTLNEYVGDLSDHHVFRVHRRPYLFLTCGTWEHYHQPTDTPDKLDYDKLHKVAELLVTLSGALDTASLSGPFEGGDTTAMEIALLDKYVPAALLRRLGLGSIAGRADITRLVTALQSTLGP